MFCKSLVTATLLVCATGTAQAANFEADKLKKVADDFITVSKLIK